MAMEKLKDGDPNSASEFFQRAVSVTPQMAYQLIQILRSENTEYVVAPYEADAQLAYLSVLEAEKGGIAAVISEDSDLLVYGCSAVVFKMDRYGNGEEIIMEKVLNTVGRVPCFKNIDRELFTGMCVLAGCDFLPSVPGVGISKAYNFVAKYRNIDRVISMLKFKKGKQVPEDYDTAFKEAVAVFQHARVYDAVSKRLKHLKPIPPQLLQNQNENLDFLGPDLSPSLAIAIAEGNLDPCTMKAFDQLLETGYLSFHCFSREEETTESNQEGCFTTVSRHKTSKKRIRGDMPPHVAKEEGNAKTITQKVLHSSESAALEKMAFPLRNEASKEKKKVAISFASSIPSNNPFKKIKQNAVQLNQEVAVDEEASEVTEIENSRIFSATPESQESVDSKLVKNTFSKSTRKSDKLLKQGPCSPVESKSSILQFFSRV